MPSSCVARGCPSRCTLEYRSLGVTFHRVPKEVMLRKKWEKALKRNSSSDFIRVCSKHFKPEDFDRTGQTVRLRDGVAPSVFTYPTNPPTPVEAGITRSTKRNKPTLATVTTKTPRATRTAQTNETTKATGTIEIIKTTRTTRATETVETTRTTEATGWIETTIERDSPGDTRATGTTETDMIPGTTGTTLVKVKESPFVNCPLAAQETKSPPRPDNDHSYALPASMSHLRARLCEALERVESLEREKRNAKDRERRTKRMVHSLLEDLRGKNLINNELKQKLSLYSGKSESNDQNRSVPTRAR